MAAATTISLTSIATPSTDILKATAIGGAVEGSPDGQTFLKPIEIVLPYTDALVPAGTDVATAKILMAPQGSTNFTAVDSTVDQATHTVHATTTHFTTFVPTVPTVPTSSNAMVLTDVQVTLGSPGSAAIAVTGSNLPSGGDAEWDGSIGNTIFEGRSSTAALVMVYDRATWGTHKLRILRYDSKGIAETSNTLDVNVGTQPTQPAGTPPTLTSITPNTTPASLNDLPLHVVGTGFTSDSTVNGHPTTFVSSTALDTVIPGDSLVNGGTLPIAVSTPGGGTSNAINLTVEAPGPTLAGIKPQTIAPGSAAFTLQVTAKTAIPANSQIVFGSTPLTTTISTAPNTLGKVAAATVPASLVTTAGRIGVAIVDPANGTGTVLPFEVMGGLPCSSTNVDLDGDSGNGCETDISSGPVCVTLRRGGYYGTCFLYRTVEHPSFSNGAAPTYITTNSAGLNQLTGATPTERPVFIQEGSTSIFSNDSYPGSQLDTSTGQLTFSGARGGVQSPADACPLGWPPVIQVMCKGTVTKLVSLSEIAK